jgi:hypothetical protein
MSENNTKNKNVSNDEIDLVDFFRRVGKTIDRWGNTFGRVLLISAVFLLKRWLPLGLSLLFGIGASYFFKTTSDPSYNSDLVLKTNTIPPDEMISFINRLHIFCLEQNKKALADAIFISPGQIDNILDVSAYWIIDNGRDGIPDFVDYRSVHNVYDTINVRMKDRFDVKVKIKIPQELSNLKEGIVKFINSDQLFLQRNDLRLRQNKEMLTRLDKDILLLDSLQKVKYFVETKNMEPRTGGQMVFLQEQKTQLVYSDIYNLYAKKQALESERDLYKDLVTVMSDFSLPAKRDNSASYYGKYLIPSFFFITLLILVLFANRNKLKEVYNKYQK